MTGSKRAAVVIYTTARCGYCHAAKRLLDAVRAEYEEVAVDARPDLRPWLADVSGQRTVPQVFINGASIGGYSELAALAQSGDLDDRLDAAASESDPRLKR